MSTIAERTAKYESLAKKFLSTKERRKYYQFECESDEGRSSTHWLDFTDDFVAEIKDIIMEGYKKNYWEEPNDGEEKPLPSFEEVLKEIDLYEFEGDEDLDNLIFEPVQFRDFYDPNHIVSMDLEHPHYYYQVTCVGYDPVREDTKTPHRVRIRLTDEEYIYLLTQRLLDEKFTFNKLLSLRPELAQKINEKVSGYYYHMDDYIENDFPYLIVFDEINADAEKILENQGA